MYMTQMMWLILFEQGLHSSQGLKILICIPEFQLC